MTVLLPQKSEKKSNVGTITSDTAAQNVGTRRALSATSDGGILLCLFRFIQQCPSSFTH